MKNILFIDACVRKNSRTRNLAEYVISKLDGDITTVQLEKTGLQSLTENQLQKRQTLIDSADYSDAMFDYAKQFAAADEIVIAAPFWDLSFPACLKIYFEQIAVCGITFRYNKGVPESFCKAKKLIYVTTAGGKIFDDSFGYGYVKALAQNFYGINDCRILKCEGLDIFGADTELLLNEAKKQAESILTV